jgi:hypothetical protein
MQTIAIPQIAEMLRNHINTDNDAPRLIAEQVLPLLKIDLTYKEVLELENFRSDLESHLDDLKDVTLEMQDEDDPLSKWEVIHRIERIITQIRGL